MIPNESLCQSSKIHLAPLLSPYDFLVRPGVYEDEPRETGLFKLTPPPLYPDHIPSTTSIETKIQPKLPYCDDLLVECVPFTGFLSLTFSVLSIFVK